MTSPDAHDDRLTPAELEIDTIGRCLLPSPVARHLGDSAVQFVGAADKVLLDDSLSGLRASGGDLSSLPAFEMAGPRDKIFFDPRTVRAGIVTCGGLAPGLNNVIRGIVIELWIGYGVRQIYGFRYGYEGLIARHGHVPMNLTPETVAHIHHDGGTVLGTSRGSQDPSEVVDNLEANGIGILFVIGGDGTMAGALRINEEARRRGLRLAVVGVPKTIDNDVGFIDRSFGFVTAYSAAVEAIRSARVEATAARDGVAFIAAEEYGLASGMAFRLPPKLPVVAMDPRWRFFTLPKPPENTAGLLIRSERRGEGPPQWPGATPIEGEAGRLIRARRGQQAETYRLFRVTAAPGQPPSAVLPQPRR